MKNKLKLRIKFDWNCREPYLLQRQYPFLKVFRRWRTVASYRNFVDAEMAKTMYVPKDALKPKTSL